MSETPTSAADAVPNPSTLPVLKTFGGPTMEDPPSNVSYRAQPVSFVRRGSRLQGRRQKAWEEHADAYVIEVPRRTSDTSVHPDFGFDARTVFGRTAPLIIEVGSGLGEAVVHAAAENPDKDFLAVEVYLPGLAQTLLKVAAHSLPNVRLVQANAPEVLDIMVPAHSVAEVWVFFPDPWHKSKHEKRRLVTPAFAQQVADALEPGGVWRLATDWEPYARQMRQIGDASPLFTNLHLNNPGADNPGADNPGADNPGADNPGADNPGADNPGTIAGWAPRFDGRILTSFESKAHRSGRAIHDLAYRRTGE